MKKLTLAWLLLLTSFCPAYAEQRERALFVSVIQTPVVLSRRDEILKLVEFSRRARIKTLFVQIYRGNQSWFPSKAADSSPYQACVKSVSEDPFALLIQKAHDAGIEVHAWINLLSLGANKKAPILKKYGPGILTKNTKQKWSLDDYKIDGQFFLEPGDTRVRAELLTLVKEIVRRYPALDGIQFDYLRYPDSHPFYGYTKVNMDRFRSLHHRAKIGEDSPAWKRWRTEQVTALLTALARKTRELHPDIQVSATGCMPLSRARYEAYQDWPMWLQSGLVDFVTLMSYSSDPAEYKQWFARAQKEALDLKKINLGVGAYKAATTSAVFTDEFLFCERSGANACVIFHYGSVLKMQAIKDFLTLQPMPVAEHRRKNRNIFFP